MNSPKQPHRQFWHTVRQYPVSPTVFAGVAISAALVIYVLADGPGSSLATWIALLPALISVLHYGMVIQAKALRQPTQSIAEELQRTADELRHSNQALRKQVNDLTNLRDIMLATGATFDRETILDELINVTTKMLQFDRGLVLLHDDKTNALTYGAFSHAAPDPESQFLLEQLRLDLDDAESEPLISDWLAGKAVLVEQSEPYLLSRLNWLLTTLDLHLFYSVPLTVGEQFKGVIVVDNSLTKMPITLEQRSLLDALAAHIAITLENARLYQLSDEQLNSKVQEMEILSRIDRELNHTLSMDRVINLTLDWILRFSNCHSALVALVDPNHNVMRFVAGYGYEPSQWEIFSAKTYTLDQGITGRAARTGEPQIVNEVSQDPSYIPIMPATRAQLSVPVMRERRVIAVISLENNNPNAFTEDDVEFIQRVAIRAAAALDNANLLAETQRERQKLEIILSHITDTVIVTDNNHRLILVNQAAMAAFHLPPKEHYVGRTFEDVFMHSALLPLYRRARQLEEDLAEELTLKDNRTLHVSIVPVEQVGWSIMAHDITHFKETDKLKNDLLATTSHDLKNPLSTIMGYIDLIGMTNPLDDMGQEYMRRVHGAVKHMRQLIDDLLDMARIESGIKLRYSQLDLRTLIEGIIMSFTPTIQEKQMEVAVNVPSDLPPVPADESRIAQVLNNLISNAIKYTPPEGHVWIDAELVDGHVKVTIRDDGLGISPEDQAQVFARFYRVRAPETDSIDGTGLGLAIVKSLVELHGGNLGLRSRLGEGSTFHFLLPLVPPARHEDNGADRLISDAGRG